MTSDMTALLAQVFPVILLALGLESGRVNVRIRRRPWWIRILVMSVAYAAYGFGMAIVSTFLGGAGPIPTAIMFILLALSLAGLVFVLLALLATDDLDAEDDERLETADGRLLEWLEERAL